MARYPLLSVERPVSPDDCPAPALLKALRDGQLQGPLAWRVRQHAKHCPSCKALQAYQSTGGGPVDNLPADAADSESDALPRGAIIGRYVVIDRVGSGGMGVVYAAFDPELDRKVAIKLLQSNSAEGQAWLLREAQAMARLSHPNVIPVFDVGTLAERVFVAMEFVDGQTARQWIHPIRPAQQVVDLFVAAGRGLAAAHAAGVVHRDFKPDNILVGKDGRVRVMDFGLARGALDVRPEPAALPDEVSPVNLFTPLTRADVLVGTPTYMAPEQHAGAPADASTDQFSFGISLHEALFGELPFEGIPEDRAEPSRWAVRPPPKGARVPARIRRVIARALSPDAHDRYPSLTSLLEDLRRDPGPARMPYVWAASVFAVTGLIFAASRIFAPGPPVSMCQGATASLRGVWDAPTRAEVESVFNATESPFVKTALPAVEDALSSYADRWVAMRTDACVATRVRGMQSDEVLSLRMLCLDRRLAELSALTRVFKQADSATVESAPLAVHSLASVETCGDVAALKARIPPPQDAALKARVEAVAASLDRAEALYATGKLKDGMDQVKPAVEAASKLHYRPLEAEALLLLGKMQRLSDPAQSVTSLQRAAWGAQTSGADDLLVEAGTALIRLESERALFSEAHLWKALVGATLDKDAQAQSLRASFQEAVAEALLREGHPGDALTALDGAAKLMSDGSGRDELTRSEILTTRGAVLRALGRVGEAHQSFSSALSIRERLLGPDHPETAVTLQQRAQTALLQDNPLGALQDFERALAINTQSFGPKSVNALQALAGTGEVLMAQGDVDGALHRLGGVLASLQTQLGPNHLELAPVLTALGEGELLKNEPKVARIHFERALRLREATLGTEHPDVAVTLTALARARLADNSAADALPLLQRALSLQTAVFTAPVPLATTQFTLAQSIRRLHQDDGRARELGTTARKNYAAAHKLRDVATVDAWLAKPSRG